MPTEMMSRKLPYRSSGWTALCTEKAPTAKALWPEQAWNIGGTERK